MADQPPPASGDFDLLQFGYKTLVDSYAMYHEDGGTGRSARPLADFESQIPVAVLQLEGVGQQWASNNRSEPSSQGGSRNEVGGGGAPRQPKAAAKRTPAPAVQMPSAPPLSSGLSREGEPFLPANQARQPEQAQPPRRLGSEKQPRSRDKGEAQGPVPAPFASLPERSMAAPVASASRGGQPDSQGFPAIGGASAQDDPAACVDPSDPESVAMWSQYYRQCADYLQQCQTSIAEPKNTPEPAAPDASHAALLEEIRQLKQQTAQLQAAVAQQPPAAAMRSPWPGVAAAPPAPYPSADFGPHPGLGGFAAGGWPSLAGMQAPSAMAHAGLGFHSGMPQAFGSLRAPLGHAVPGSMFSAGPPVDDEALANLLMAWYYSGYYTGQYAARQGKQ